MGSNNQSEVAALMGAKAELLQPEFVISTGDNFYPSAGPCHWQMVAAPMHATGNPEQAWPHTSA